MGGLRFQAFLGFAETELNMLNRLARISMARIGSGVTWRAKTVSSVGSGVLHHT
tara:strand:+ start:185 stop:346 length:162 start_codon:yes stop_codon:yes gene_type:complete